METKDPNRNEDVSAWKDLFVPEPVLDALRDLGFKDPTPIQRETLPAAIKGRRDIIGAAETGSGKNSDDINSPIMSVFQKKVLKANFIFFR